MIDLVMAALAAGATAGLTNTASAGVKDAYEGLKSLTRKALHRDEADEQLEQQLADPQAHSEELRAELAAAHADNDAELVAAARKLLALVEYRIDVHDNQGVQIGDGNTMTLNFGK